MWYMRSMRANGASRNNLPGFWFVIVGGRDTRTEFIDLSMVGRQSRAIEPSYTI